MLTLLNKTESKRTDETGRQNNYHRVEKNGRTLWRTYSGTDNRPTKYNNNFVEKYPTSVLIMLSAVILSVYLQNINFIQTTKDILVEPINSSKETEA